MKWNTMNSCRPFRSGLAFLGLIAWTGSASAEFQFRGYGFLVPSVIATSAGVESFSQPNASAFTAAQNPVFHKTGTDSLMTWQAAQSRIGLKLSDPDGIDAVAEFDFVDFTKSSPTTASLPRLRRAFVQWQTGSGWKLQLGQDWDLISPLAPFTYNFVGHYFESGDIAFMRMQWMGIKREGDWEYGWALGMPTQNPTSALNGMELGKWPTLAWRQTWMGLQDHRFGISILGASLQPSSVDSSRIFGGAFNVFAEGKSKTTRWTGEAYIGQNTANLGMLGLGYGDRSHPRVREVGAYVSFKTPLSESSRVFGGMGSAWILNPESLLSSYSRNGGIATLNTPSTGPGLERNQTLRLGLDHDLRAGLLGFVELAYLSTTHHLLSQDSGMNPNQTAWVMNSGVFLNF